MKFLTANVDEIDVFDKKCVIAIGMFDGLHKGHKKVIAKTRALAQKYKAMPCVLTFSPHPSRVIDMGREPVEMLCQPAQRADMFSRAGVKRVFVKKFTKQFAAMTPENFAKFLKRKFPNLRAIVTGYNFLFGKNASGNAETLKTLSVKNGWEYVAVDGVYLSDGRRISSSEMRNAVRAGRLDEFFAMRGEHYSCSGKVQRGKRLGRIIGFPTLNLPWNPDCKLPFGAYAVELTRCKTGEKFKAVASYGTSPTVGETAPLWEVNLFKNVAFGAPSKIEIKVVKFLRSQRKFASLEELATQIAIDKANAKLALK